MALPGRPVPFTPGGGGGAPRAANPAPVPMQSNRKQFAPHAPADTLHAAVSVVEKTDELPGINGDTVELRSQFVDDVMHARGARLPGADGFNEDGAPTGKLGAVSQDLQRYCVRVRAMDVDQPRVIRAEGMREAHGIADVHIDASQAAPYALYPGKVFALSGYQKSYTNPVVQGVRIQNPVGLPTTHYKANHAAAASSSGITNPTPAKKTKVVAADATAATAVTYTQKPGAFKTLVAFGPFREFMAQTLKDVERVYKLAAMRGDVGAVMIVGPLSQEHADDNIGYIEEDDSLNDEVKRIVAETWAAAQKELQRRASRRGAGKVNLSAPKLILVPSLSDPFHEYVYPQPGYSLTSCLEDEDDDDDDDEAKLPPNTVLPMTNPCRVDVNGADIGVTSYDILRAMKLQMAEEASATHRDHGFRSRYDPADPFAVKPAFRGAVDELLAAGTFCPLLPPPEDLPLDVSLAASHVEFGASSPDILLLPSRMPFAEAVAISAARPQDRVIVASPGPFTCTLPTSAGRHRLMELTVSRTRPDETVWQKTTIEWHFLEDLERLRQ